MKTSTAIGRLLRFKPHIYLVTVLFSLAYYSLPLLFGLITRAFFNRLTGEAEVGLNVWTLIVLFLVNRVAFQISELGFAGYSAYVYYLQHNLLKRNLFRSMLKTPGGQADWNVGEVINRFNKDTVQFG